MSRYFVLICRTDDGQPDSLTELDRVEVPTPDAGSLHRDTALDQLEAQTLATGHEVMRHLLVRQWERVDQQLVANYRELFPPLPPEGGRARPHQGGQPDRDPASAASGAPRRKRRSSAAGQ